MLQNTNDLELFSINERKDFDDFVRNCDLVGKVSADHVCIKCSSNEIYERERKLFEFDSRFVYQSIISKRRIAIIGLSKGLATVVGSLNFLELSDQKPDGSQKDCVDHIEIIPAGISYEELILKVKESGYSVTESTKLHHSTYDVILPLGFMIRLSQEMLVDKIKREEMV